MKEGIKVKNKNKKGVITIIIKILFVLGFLIFTYPFTSNIINNYFDQKIIKNYEINITNRSDFELLSEYKQNMQFNSDLYDNQSNFNNLGLKERTTIDDSKDIIGVLYIPKINISLPIFNQTTNEYLKRGASLLENSSYPTGGVNTHAVLTSHSGMSHKRLFSELDKLEVYDRFYIEVSNKMLIYEVFNITEVLPYETELLKIIDDEDLVTLFTCSPYMVNSHRLLVQGRRVLDNNMQKEDYSLVKKVNDYHLLKFKIFVFAIIIALILIVLVTFNKFRKLQ